MQGSLATVKFLVDMGARLGDRVAFDRRVLARVAEKGSEDIAAFLQVCVSLF